MVNVLAINNAYMLSVLKYGDLLDASKFLGVWEAIEKESGVPKDIETNISYVEKALKIMHGEAG